MVESASPGLDAEVLLAHCLQVPRSYLYAWPGREVEAVRQESFKQLLARRRQGEPVAYLTGIREFYSLPLKVTADTLIPRADTELLVELALDYLPVNSTATVLDLGTGSGAIALAVARHRPGCTVVATDISLPALSVAQENARRLQINNVYFLASNWLQALAAGKVRLILSNPPYIPPGDPHWEQKELAYEPLNALLAAEDGLLCLHEIIRRAPACLGKNGRLLLEHGYNQAQQVKQLLSNATYTNIQSYADLGGHIRVSGGDYRCG